MPERHLRYCMHEDYPAIGVVTQQQGFRVLYGVLMIIWLNLVTLAVLAWLYYDSLVHILLSNTGESTNQLNHYVIEKQVCTDSKYKIPAALRVEEKVAKPPKDPATSDKIESQFYQSETLVETERSNELVVETKIIKASDGLKSVKRLIARSKQAENPQAIQMLEAAYVNGQVNFQLLSELGARYSRAGYWKKARLVYERICGDSNGEARCLYNLAVCYDRLQQFANARAYYQHALRQDQQRGVSAESLPRDSIIRRLEVIAPW